MINILTEANHTVEQIRNLLQKSGMYVNFTDTASWRFEAANRVYFQVDVVIQSDTEHLVLEFSTYQEGSKKLPSAVRSALIHIYKTYMTQYFHRDRFTVHDSPHTYVVATKIHDKDKKIRFDEFVSFLAMVNRIRAEIKSPIMYAATEKIDSPKGSRSARVNLKRR